jgi:hypothetical protein
VHCVDFIRQFDIHSTTNVVHMSTNQNAFSSKTLPLALYAQRVLEFGTLPSQPALSGRYLRMLEESLDEGESITCDWPMLSNPLALLHIIFPLAARAARAGGIESEKRAEFLRSSNLDKSVFNFAAPRAIRAFRKAGQEPGFAGLCQISDPDDFLSVLAFGLGMSQKARDLLGYRDNRNLSGSLSHTRRRSLVVVRGTAPPVT